MLTKRQKQVLDYIKNFIKKHDYAPSYEEIIKHLGLSSVSTAHYHVSALEKLGLLKKEDNQPRAIDVIDEVGIIKVPILGTITAGQPIEAVEATEGTIAIAENEINKFAQYYALRVKGESMINEGIFDGDIVVLRRQKTADNGQTVVAIIDDDEATLKKIYKEKGRIRLQPANQTMLPFYRKDVEIRGVVVKIVRNLDSYTEKEKSPDKFTRRIDYSWDFRGEKTKSYTHGMHTYPAMFIPQVARRLLQTYSKKGDTICDIFCGSGTALVESKLLGRNAYGIDLNPLAVFLAKAKTTEISPSTLKKEYFSLIEKINKIKNNEISLPNFMNIEFWFKKNVIIKLAKIKKAINKIKNNKVKNFFLAAFSEIVRLTSNTKNGEFKLFRIPKDKLEDFDPDVLGIFRKKAENNIKGMDDFYKDCDKKSWVKVILGDSSKDNNIKENSIDCIVTSPPYGDSRTTVAYGQFSRLSSQWIDLFEEADSASGVDNTLLGGKATKDLIHNLKSQHLEEALDKIKKKDPKRARDVLSFYLGLEKCMRQAYKILKPKKYFCLVIGNRLVKQVRISTDFIVAELGENIGFYCEDIIVRNIPGKRMPSKTSPTNVVGELESTMTKESIVILRKN